MSKRKRYTPTRLVPSTTVQRGTSGVPYRNLRSFNSFSHTTHEPIVVGTSSPGVPVMVPGTQATPVLPSRRPSYLIPSQGASYVLHRQSGRRVSQRRFIVTNSQEDMIEQGAAYHEEVDRATLQAAPNSAFYPDEQNTTTDYEDY